MTRCRYDTVMPLCDVTNRVTSLPVWRNPPCDASLCPCFRPSITWTRTPPFTSTPTTKQPTQRFDVNTDVRDTVLYSMHGYAIAGYHVRLIFLSRCASTITRACLAIVRSQPSTLLLCCFLNFYDIALFDQC